MPASRSLGKALRVLRWVAVIVYLAASIYIWRRRGITIDRDGLLLWISIGLGCFCIGRHPLWLVLVAIDFLPLGLMLLVYDYLRGVADTAGMPTWWHPPLEVDRVLFFGTQPVLWLQEHLKHQRPAGEWYDLLVTVTYASFFFLPYLTAGVMWLRSRTDFYRWSLRFVALSFFSFSIFILIPTAPPWAAALCDDYDVIDHPNEPARMNAQPHDVPGNLLGDYTAGITGANPYVERIAMDGFRTLHLGIARSLWTPASRRQIAWRPCRHCTSGAPCSFACSCGRDCTAAGTISSSRIRS